MTARRRFPFPVSRFPFLIAGLLAAPVAVPAQALPSPSQAPGALQQALQENPGLGDIIRQRLLQSGLTSDQVRARLAASGYAPALLDAFMGTVPGAGVAIPGAQELAAVEALGLGPIRVAGERLSVDTGPVRRNEGQRAEEIASGNYVFGVDVFRRTTTQFLPTLAGPVPPDYRLGPGDNLVLILTGDVEFAYTLQVTREGFILIPQVGQLFVSNLTLDQLRDVLYARLGRVYSGVKRSASATTRFDISVASVRANQVYVVGEVEQPGAYQISALGTVLTALYAAGGVTGRANLRAVEVRRVGKVLTTFDLYDYLLRGDTRNDVRLETGDVLFVGVHGVRARVTGAVRRPAIYEVKAGETLADLIRDAAGFRPDAALNRVSVFRLLPAALRGPGAPARAVVDIPLTTPPLGRRETGKVAPGDPPASVLIPPMPLEDGDSVVVDTVRELAAEYHVTIVGMVHRPGSYPWREAMTLRDLMLLARGPQVGADLREAEIARLPADRSRGQLATTVRVGLDSTYLLDRDASGRYFGPPGLSFPASGTAEVPLQPYDNVLILRQPEFELQRTVQIEGEVSFPGTYALRSKGERLVDLIRRSGGLTARAYPDGIRFLRSVGGAGRIDVDLPKALKDTTGRDNVTLQPDDSIFIPEYIPSVRVVGAVNAAGSVLYRRGAGLEYYIDGAGGFTYLADKGRVSVRYANGTVATRHRVLFVASDPRPGPGSEIVVPVKDTSNPTNKVALFGAIAQILASTVAIIAIATKL